MLLQWFFEENNATSLNGHMLLYDSQLPVWSCIDIKLCSLVEIGIRLCIFVETYIRLCSIV